MTSYILKSRKVRSGEQKSAISLAPPYSSLVQQMLRYCKKKKRSKSMIGRRSDYLDMCNIPMSYIVVWCGKLMIFHHWSFCSIQFWHGFTADSCFSCRFSLTDGRWITRQPISDWQLDEPVSGNTLTKNCMCYTGKDDTCRFFFFLLLISVPPWWWPIIPQTSFLVFCSLPQA